jgi:hypothetical protein
MQTKNHILKKIFIWALRAPVKAGSAPGLRSQSFLGFCHQHCRRVGKTPKKDFRLRPNASATVDQVSKIYKSIKYLLKPIHARP